MAQFGFMTRTPSTSKDRARSIVRVSAIYGLVVTIGFAFTPTTGLTFSGLGALQASLGLGGELPDADSPSTMMFANLMGGVVTVWALFRICRPSLMAGAADTVARALFSLGMITALAAGATPLVGAMLLLELAWGLVQGIAVITARRARQADEPKLVVSSHAHR